MTLVLQALSSFLLGLHLCLKSMIARTIFDTQGLPMSYAPLCVFGFRIICYIHYPFCRLYHSSKPELTSPTRKVYHRLLYMAYKFSLSFSKSIICNSSWTAKRIPKVRSSVKIIFPYCNIPLYTSLKLQPIDRHGILSLAQFRPEKNQKEQVLIFRDFLKGHPDLAESTRLYIVGGCRNSVDVEQSRSIQEMVDSLGLQVPPQVNFKPPKEFIKIVTNPSDREIGAHIEKCVIFLHTMIDEHFGISVAESMAAGLIPICHASGGPQEDIVEPPGSLCRTRSEFVQSIASILRSSNDEIYSMKKYCRKLAMQKFGNSGFSAYIQEISTNISK